MVAPESLANLAIVIYEGVFIMLKTLKEPAMTAVQLGQYRNFRGRRGHGLRLQPGYCFMKYFKSQIFAI